MRSASISDQTTLLIEVTVTKIRPEIFPYFFFLLYKELLNPPILFLHPNLTINWNTSDSFTTNSSIHPSSSTNIAWFEKRFKYHEQSNTLRIFRKPTSFFAPKSSRASPKWGAATCKRRPRVVPRYWTCPCRAPRAIYHVRLGQGPSAVFRIPISPPAARAKLRVRYRRRPRSLYWHGTGTYSMRYRGPVPQNCSQWHSARECLGGVWVWLWEDDGTKQRKPKRPEPEAVASP